MPARNCAECGQRLPRPIPGPGRTQQYCNHACRQKAYRRRGGRASGTTGAQRHRQQTPPPATRPTPGPQFMTISGAKSLDDTQLDVGAANLEQAQIMLLAPAGALAQI
jgi:hypothetical protein